MASTIKVNVHTFDQELDFSIKTSTTGKQLLEQVAKILRIYEYWYFGLQYEDRKGRENWVKKNKKILSQIKPADDMGLKFRFRVQFYPERVEKELIDDNTIAFFYAQASNDLKSGRIKDSLETWVLLTSYELYVSFGEKKEPGPPTEELMARIHLPDIYEVYLDPLVPVIMAYYSQLHNMLRVEAMLEYLKLMEAIPGYGVRHYDVTKMDKKELTLAVHPLGLDVHRRNNKLYPEIGFKWSEVGDLSNARKKFILQTMDTKGPNFVFISDSGRDAKRLLRDCVGAHDMYNLRRRSPTLEIRMLAKQNQEGRERERINLQNLSKETNIRKSLQIENEMLKDEILKIENDLSIYREGVKNVSDEMDNKEVDSYFSVKNALAFYERKIAKVDVDEDAVFENHDESLSKNGLLIGKLQSLISDLAEAKHKTEYVRSKLLQQDSLQSTLLRCKSILHLEQKKPRIVAFENM